MRGVQFLTDSQWHKTAALLDSREHRQLWADVSANISSLIIDIIAVRHRREACE